MAQAGGIRWHELPAAVLGGSVQPHVCRGHTALSPTDRRPGHHRAEPSASVPSTGWLLRCWRRRGALSSTQQMLLLTRPPWLWGSPGVGSTCTLVKLAAGKDASRGCSWGYRCSGSWRGLAPQDAFMAPLQGWVPSVSLRVK